MTVRRTCQQPFSNYFSPSVAGHAEHFSARSRFHIPSFEYETIPKGLYQLAQRGRAETEGAKRLECAASRRFWMAKEMAEAKAPGCGALQTLRAARTPSIPGVQIFRSLRTIPAIAVQYPMAWDLYPERVAPMPQSLPLQLLLDSASASSLPML